MSEIRLPHRHAFDEVEVLPVGCSADEHQMGVTVRHRPMDDPRHDARHRLPVATRLREPVHAAVGHAHVHQAADPLPTVSRGVLMNELDSPSEPRTWSQIVPAEPDCRNEGTESLNVSGVNAPPPKLPL